MCSAALPLFRLLCAAHKLQKYPKWNVDFVINIFVWLLCATFIVCVFFGHECIGYSCSRLHAIAHSPPHHTTLLFARNVALKKNSVHAKLVSHLYNSQAHTGSHRKINVCTIVLYRKRRLDIYLYVCWYRIYDTARAHVEQNYPRVIFVYHADATFLLDGLLCICEPEFFFILLLFNIYVYMVYINLCFE